MGCQELNRRQFFFKKCGALIKSNCNNKHFAMHLKGFSERRLAVRLRFATCSSLQPFLS
jgi:hypothetical protein